MDNVETCLILGFAEVTTYFAQVLSSNDSVLKLTGFLFAINFCSHRTEVGQSGWTAV